jgi:hypothetical protein
MDVLLRRAAHGEEFARRLAAALTVGPAVVNDVIAAELAALFDEERTLWATLSKAWIHHVVFPRTAIHLAGRALRRYRRAGGTRDRVSPTS